MRNIKLKKTNYRQLVSQISDAFVFGQQKAVSAVNSYLVETYWKIGQYIVEYEQGGSGKAEYGKRLLEQLSKDLSLLPGRGFSLSNIKRMRQFYQTFPILATPSQELDQIGAKPSHHMSWSHYVELLKIEDTLERSFYEQQTMIENWSVAQLVRQKKTSLYLRLAASKDKEGILKLAKQGQKIEHPADIIREPYILDFLQIPEAHNLN
jgi:hypothetical protein